METQIALQALMMLVPSALSAAIGWLAARYKAARAATEADETRTRAAVDSCVVLMGARIDALCDCYEETRPTVEQKEHLQEEFELYKGCGGDGLRASRVARILGVSKDELEA